MTGRVVSGHSSKPEYTASGPLLGARAPRGWGPGTNGEPLRFMESRFHVSICSPQRRVRWVRQYCLTHLT